mgnify:CR=1 FL=1
MLTPLAVILPIFALIFAGWLARRTGVLGPHATTELNRFVVYLALPALLFDIVAHARWADIWQPAFIGAFGLGALAVFALTIILRLRRSRHLADATIDGLNAGYANTGFIGFPLAAIVLGEQALAPTLIATILTVCVLFAIGIVLIEIGLQTEKQSRRLVVKAGRQLLRNPLVIAPFAGALVPILGLSIPESAETFLKLLGGSAAPCALVTLGIFLATKREATERDLRTTTFLSGLKLILQPVLTWGLASFVFGLSPLLTHTAVLLAALPTGTGPFMLAEFYRREAAVTSNVILATTVISLVTISAYLALIG